MNSITVENKITDLYIADNRILDGTFEVGVGGA